MRFHDQTFDAVDINIDDNVFTGCTFNHCRLIYKGGDFARIAANTFNECVWDFVGPAGNTVNFLRQLYHGGAKNLVERTIETIRTPL